MSNPNMSDQDWKNVEFAIKAIGASEAQAKLIRSLASLMFSCGRLSAMNDAAERQGRVPITL